MGLEVIGFELDHFLERGLGLVQLSLPDPDARQAVTRLDRLRAQFYGRAEKALRLVEAAATKMNLPRQIVRLEKSGIELDFLLVLGERCRQITLALIGVAKMIMRERKLRRDSQRLLELLDGRKRAVLIVVGAAQKHARLGAGRLEFDHHFEGPRRFSVPFISQLHQRKVEVVLRIPRVQLGGPPERLPRFSVHSFLEKGCAQELMELS